MWEIQEAGGEFFLLGIILIIVYQLIKLVIAKIKSKRTVGQTSHFVAGDPENRSNPGSGVPGGLPVELQPTKEELDAMDLLFRDRKVRPCYSPASMHKGKLVCSALMIVVDERLSVWFFKKNGEWVYDGWEAGDYSKDWLKQVLE